MEFTKENVIKILNDCLELLNKSADEALERSKDSCIKDYLEGKHASLKNTCSFLNDIISIINDMTTTEDLIDKEHK